VLLGVGAIVAVIAVVFGLGNYVQWTIRYAAERRLPPLARQFAIYDDPTLWWWLAVAGTAIFVRRARWLIAVPWLWSEWRLFVSDDPLEPEVNFLRLWPLVMALALVVTLVNAGRASARRAYASASHETGQLEAHWTFPLFVLAAIHGAFLSQSTWGSTYGIWPLLVLLLAVVWRQLDAPLVGSRRAGYRLPGPGSQCLAPGTRSPVPTPMPTTGTRSPLIPAVLVSLVMLHHAWVYVSENQRLTYAKVMEGELHHSTLPALRGLAARGPWLPDFEELVAWSDRHIPRGDTLLAMPAEDLFYYATGRRPRFPVLMFDGTVNPYSPREIAALAIARDVRWIIIKKRLQLNGDPYSELPATLALLGPGATVAAELRNYTILRVGPHTRSRPTTE
jgi:hypothetical protein